MENIIELTNENINYIKYNDVVAVTIAEAGAMGEPNGFYVALKNYDLYHMNFGQTEIENEKLLEAFPLLKDFSCFCGQVTNLDNRWKTLYMGFGNYLLVRERYYDLIINYIEENFTKDNQRCQLYQNWYDIITKVVK